MVKEKPKAGILKTLIEFQDRLIEQLSYHQYVLLLDKLEKNIFAEGNAKKYLDDSEQYEKDMLQIKKKLGERKLLVITKEFVYKNYYQIYEEFINSLFVELFKAFPVFLKKDNDNIIVSYDNLFDEENIEIIRMAVIEKRVKEIIQSNNVINILKKFKVIFGIDISLEKEEEEFLILFALKRNVLIHNNGLVNSLFLNELKKNKIKTTYKLNDSVISPEGKSEKIATLIRPITTKISSIIIKDLDRITKHHQNIC